MRDTVSKKNPEVSDERKSKPGRWWSAVRNLWIAAVILLFFALRVFGSHAAQRIWHSVRAR